MTSRATARAVRSARVAKKKGVICSFDGIFMISSTLRNTSFYMRELSEILTILVDWRPGTHSPGTRASKIMKISWFSKVSRGSERVARGQGIEKHDKP